VVCSFLAEGSLAGFLLETFMSAPLSPVLLLLLLLALNSAAAAAAAPVFPPPPPWVGLLLYSPEDGLVVSAEAVDD